MSKQNTMELASIFENSASTTYEVDGIEYVTDSTGVAYTNIKSVNIPGPNFVTIKIILCLLAILVLINIVRLVKMVISDNN